MNYRIEQDHRGIKSYTKVRKRFLKPFYELKFCTMFEEIKQNHYFPKFSRVEQRRVFARKFHEFQNMTSLAA